jgi:chromosome segregation ATPase
VLEETNDILNSLENLRQRIEKILTHRHHQENVTHQITDILKQHTNQISSLKSIENYITLVETIERYTQDTLQVVGELSEFLTKHKDQKLNSKKENENVDTTIEQLLQKSQDSLLKLVEHQKRLAPFRYFLTNAQAFCFTFLLETLFSVI